MTAQRQLVKEARAHGMRVVGPKALGVANTDPQVRLNATLAPNLPLAGRVSFFSQSGTLGVALLTAAASVGWACRHSSPPATARTCRATTCCSTGRPIPPRTSSCSTWSRSATRASSPDLPADLPAPSRIIAVKSGRWTEAPTTAASTMAPVDDSSRQALFEHSGVIRVQNATQMFDAAQLLAYQPLPAGSRVAVVGNSTALNLLVVDALDSEDLVLAG